MRIEAVSAEAGRVLRLRAFVVLYRCPSRSLFEQSLKDIDSQVRRRILVEIMPREVFSRIEGLRRMFTFLLEEYCYNTLGIWLLPASNLEKFLSEVKKFEIAYEELDKLVLEAQNHPYFKAVKEYVEKKHGKELRTIALPSQRFYVELIPLRIDLEEWKEFLEDSLREEYERKKSEVERKRKQLEEELEEFEKVYQEKLEELRHLEEQLRDLKETGVLLVDKCRLRQEVRWLQSRVAELRSQLRSLEWDLREIDERYRRAREEQRRRIERSARRISLSLRDLFSAEIETILDELERLSDPNSFNSRIFNNLLLRWEKVKDDLRAFFGEGAERERVELFDKLFTAVKEKDKEVLDLLAKSRDSKIAELARKFLSWPVFSLDKRGEENG